MMRRINLLPASYALRAKQRRTKGMVVAGGVMLLLALVGWRFLLGTQVASAQEELEAVQAKNASLRNEIAGLQRYDEMQSEVQTRAGELLTVFAGDVAWASVLNDVAMVTPEGVWLTNLTGSAGTTEGAAPVGTESAEVAISPSTPFGRIQFQGKALDMTDVGTWMLSLRKVDEFQTTWLNSATEEEASEGGRKTFTFDSTVELNDKSSSVLRELEDLAGGKASS